MERTTKPTAPQSTKLRWRKTGGGSLRWNNQIIKPGQVFEANLDELPKAFMDTLQCLDSKELQAEKAALQIEAETPEVLYSLKKATKGLYNVVNEEGKPINEKPLSKEQAEELLVAIS